MSVLSAGKILRYPERMAAYKAGKPMAPVTIELDLTASCQHKCPACVGGDYQNATLGVEEALRILRDCRDYGVLGVMLTGGGEPLMHPKCVEITEYANQIGLEVGLITNGGLLTPDSIPRLLASCKWIRVSLDAGDAPMYRLVHGMDESEWNKVLGNIDELACARHASGSACAVGVGYLVSQDTKRGMVAAAVMFSGRGENGWRFAISPDYLQFRPPLWDFTKIDDVLPLCKQYETSDFKVIHSEQKYAQFTLPPWRDYGYCHGAYFAGVIQADGNMPICCHLRGMPEFYIGNLHEQSLSEIWGGARMREVLGGLDVSKCVPSCRCDTNNRVLHSVTTIREHEAFL